MKWRTGKTQKTRPPFGSKAGPRGPHSYEIVSLRMPVVIGLMKAE